MNQAKIIVAVAAVCSAMSGANALLGTFGAVAAGSGTALSFTGVGAGAATTTVLATGAGLAVAGGLGVILALGKAQILSNVLNRGKRSTDRLSVNQDVDLALAMLAGQEPGQCYRRFICDVATGKMEVDSSEAVLSLFTNEVPVDSPRFDFNTAAKLGMASADPIVCERRFSCFFTGEQLREMITTN